MTEKTAPWWRSFVGKRRKAARESASILEQEFAAHAANEANQRSTTNPQLRNAPTTNSQSDGGKSVHADDTYDDSTVQPTFSESANRRALRVSRSGRFKEKRRMRVGLPQDGDDGEAASKD